MVIAAPEALTPAIEPQTNDVTWIKEGAYFPNHPVIREALQLDEKLMKDEMDHDGMVSCVCRSQPGA